MDDEPSVCTTRGNLFGDLVERELPIAEVAEHEPQREERRRHRPRDDDLQLRELLARQRGGRDDDRPVAGADACPVREQRVVLLHEGVRRERERRHLEPARPRPLVQGLDVGEDLLEVVAASVDALGRERPEHERVVGIGAMADADAHEARDASKRGGFASALGNNLQGRISG